jgi:hypothetical protein
MSDAYYHRGLTIEVDLDFPRATIEGNAVPVSDKLFRLFGLSISPRTRMEKVRLYCERFIDQSDAFPKREKKKNEHLEKLKEGVDKWNEWREEQPEVRPLLYDTNLTEQALGMKLDNVNFANAVLINADLRNQSLKNASFHEANLGGANLHGANLTKAVFCRTDLYETELTEAKLIKTNLQGTQLAKTDFTKATLLGCKVYGMSAWDLKLGGTKQKDLLIRYRRENSSRKNRDTIETELEVDDLQVAQFLYMLLNNQNLRTVIDATTSKVVLILGRFSDDRKPVLDAIRNKLRAMGKVPILFDFEPSYKRDLTETIQLLASLSKFVIADLSDARSIPQELSHIVPNLPSVPIQPILLAPQREYAMFEHWRRYPWVLSEFVYEDESHLMRHLNKRVVRPAEDRRKLLSTESSLLARTKRSLSNARRRIKELRDELEGLQK